MTILMAFGIVVGSVMLPQVLMLGMKERVSNKAWVPIGIFVGMMLWCCSLTVTNDQIALKEGKTAVVTLTNRIINRLDNEGYMFSTENPYVVCLVGRPAENILFQHSRAFEIANAYARFGCFSTEAGNYRRTFKGVLNEYCGTWLNLASEESYNVIISSDLTRQMPCFPQEGSIIERDGVVIVKISELY